MSDPIARLNAALEGRYRVEREIGEGGMATVYLADDVRHERKVALKVLKPALAAVVGGERFLAEIKTTANLQHPHILPLFDSGEADTFLFYVMPYVQGESLREKLDREKQLGVGDSLTITQKVASALGYAHGHGVVHRDIKPANILLSEQGEPLIADFGIALAVAHAGGGRITETGLSLGTPYYMSPEQATERDVDPRSDVYALGCVLYEMLAGQPPFSGATGQAVLVQILTTDAPSITTVRKTVPPHVAAALARALEKLPADRFDGAAGFVAALGDPGFTYEGHSQSRPRAAVPSESAAETAAAPTGSPKPWLRDPRSMVSLAAATVFALLLGTGVLQRPAARDAVPFRVQPAGFDVSATGSARVRLAISRDGSRIAVIRFDEGSERIFVRRSDQLELRELAGTADAQHVTLSPDGASIAFVVEGEIRRAELSGGPVLPVTMGQSPHWGTEGTIVFTRSNDLYRVSSAAGGEPELLLDADSIGGVQWPFLLPAGDAIVFSTDPQGALETAQLVLFDIDTGQVTQLGLSGNNPQYAATGHLLYGHASQALMAVAFDLQSKRVTGEPVVVLPDVWVTNIGATQFTVSETGTALHALSTATIDPDRQLVVVDRDGTATPLALGEGTYNGPRFSPNDGRSIVYEAGGQIWLYNLFTGRNTTLTSEGNSIYPFWSRDGRYVYFSTRRTGTLERDGFRKLADGSGGPESLFRREGSNYPQASHSDESLFLVRENAVELGNRDLVIATQGPDSVTFSDFLVADYNEFMGTISPDGRWVAYVSDESEVFEVYIRSFPGAEGQRKVSIGGGTEPVWAPNQTAIYYRNGTSVMSAALGADGALVDGGLEQVFDENFWAVDSNGGVHTSWDVHPDGESFVLVRGGQSEAGGAGFSAAPVLVVMNWFEELLQRMAN